MRSIRLAMVFGMVMSVFTILSALFADAQVTGTPQVTVGDQLVLEGFVTIDSIYSQRSGFVVIHRASDGGVVGVSQSLSAGWTNNLRINLNTAAAEIEMSAMLHVDDGVVGTYEFGMVEGADLPVKHGDQFVYSLFNAQVLDATDQKVLDSRVTIRSVVIPADGWVVVRSGDKDRFGDVLGQTLVKAGTTTDVTVALTGDLTSVLWPMLHVDDGEVGVYEFDGGEIDAPIVMNGAAASAPIWTVNHLRVNDQPTIHGDNLPAMQSVMNMSMVMLHLKSVFTDGPGIVSVHADDNGQAGRILGLGFVKDGMTENVHIMLDESADIPPLLWLMLRMDGGTVGKYDGLDVDAPAFADGEVVTFTINTAFNLR